jgi:hypothetical protein
MSQFDSNLKTNTYAKNSESQPQNQGGPTEQDERIAVNGFAQVLDMLKVADPAFRESLLRRIASKDKNLALSLRKDLAFLGL